jgi:hypothetical protein
MLVGPEEFRSWAALALSANERLPALRVVLALIGMDQDLEVVRKLRRIGIGRVTEDLAEALRVIGLVGEAIPVDDAEVRRAHHQREPALLERETLGPLRELAFVLLESRDVGVGPDEADHLAVGAAQHRLADDDPLRHAAGTAAQRLDFARPMPLRDEAHVFGVVALGFGVLEDLAHVVADGLLARLADLLQPRVVHRQVAPLRILEIHRVGVFLDERGRERELVLELLLPQMALGRVDARDEQADHRALLIHHDVSSLRVAPAVELELGHFGRCIRAALERRTVERKHAFRDLGGKAVLDTSADDLGARAAEPALPRAVDEQVLAGGIAKRQRDRHRIDEVARELRLVAQRLAELVDALPFLLGAHLLRGERAREAPREHDRRRDDVSGEAEQRQRKAKRRVFAHEPERDDREEEGHADEQRGPEGAALADRDEKHHHQPQRAGENRELHRRRDVRGEALREQQHRGGGGQVQRDDRIHAARRTCGRIERADEEGEKRERQVRTEQAMLAEQEVRRESEREDAEPEGRRLAALHQVKQNRDEPQYGKAARGHQIERRIDAHAPPSPP